MPIRGRRAIVAVVVALTIAVAGCGGAAHSSTGAQHQTATPPTSTNACAAYTASSERIAADLKRGDTSTTAGQALLDDAARNIGTLTGHTSTPAEQSAVKADQALETVGAKLVAADSAGADQAMTGLDPKAWGQAITDVCG